MAYSIKAVLRKKPNKDKLFPIVIRITLDRKSTYLYTGQYIDEKHWDTENKKVKKSHPYSTRLNHLILNKLTEANKTLLDLQSENAHYSAQHIKREITQPIIKKTVNEVASDYLEELQHRQKYTQRASDKVRINHLLEYANTNQLAFQQVNESFLRGLRLFLKVKKQNSERSIMNHFVIVRTLFNRAIRMGIVDQSHYPFGRNKIRIKFPETKKIGLTIQEIKQLELLENLTPQEQHARNIWLFSFYLAGMRVGDVLKIKWTNIYDDRLHYTMNKNEKLLSFKLPQKTLPILDYYKSLQETPNDFVFPEMKKADSKNPKDQYTKTKTATKKLNKYLSQIAKKAGITKKLTMHIARHSFGNIAGDKIPIQMLQKLYRHSSITTTINYQQNFMHKETDDALDKVINF